MADAFRAKGSSNKLEDAILKLTNHQLSLGEIMQSMSLKFDELLLRMSPLLSTPTSVPPPMTTLPLVSATNHRMKLDVPRFDGMTPLVESSRSTNFSSTMLPRSKNDSLSFLSI